MAYCFDTSVLIECWSRSYPPDVFPGFQITLIKPATSWVR